MATPISARPPPKIVASGLAKRLVTQASVTATVVTIPATITIAGTRSCQRMTSSDSEVSMKAPSSPKA